MKNQIFILAAFLFVGLLFTPVSLRSQTRASFTRTALSRMDVLSRAQLFEMEIADVARREGVDPLILWTIAYNETRFRPWLTSPKNARGMMQFIPPTASRFGLSDPFEPSASIRAAARYVKYLSGLFGGRLDSILAAYNAGEGTVLAYLHGRPLLANGKRINPTGLRSAGGVPPYRETANYVANGRTIYRWLQTQGRFDGIPRISGRENDGMFASHESTLSDKSGDPKSVGISVLYDPRTGNRYLADNREKLQPLEQSGAVIVSPEVRSLPARKARSTFTGILR